IATRRHRDDRAAPRQSQQAAYARSKTAKPLHASLARRTLLCVDPMAAPHPRPLGVLHPELPRIRSARPPRYPLQTILRFDLKAPAGLKVFSSAAVGGSLVVVRCDRALNFES